MNKKKKKNEEKTVSAKPLSTLNAQRECQRREGEKEAEKIFDAAVVENFPYLLEAKQTQSRIL